MSSANRPPTRGHGIKDVFLFAIPLGAALLFLIGYLVSTQSNLSPLAFAPLLEQTPPTNAPPTAKAATARPTLKASPTALPRPRAEASPTPLARPSDQAPPT